MAAVAHITGCAPCPDIQTGQKLLFILVYDDDEPQTWAKRDTRKMFDTTTTITELNFLFVIDGIFKSPRYKLPFFFLTKNKKIGSSFFGLLHDCVCQKMKRRTLVIILFLN